MKKKSIANQKTNKNRLPIRLAHDAFKKIHMGEDITDQELEALFDSFYVKSEEKTVYVHPIKRETLYEHTSIQNAEWSHIIVPDVENELLNLFSKNPELLYNVPPRKFEEIIASIFKNQGFNVELTPQTRDGGFDILAVQNDQITGESVFLIECKRYSLNNKVGIGTVQRMFGVVESKRANKGIIATTSSFSRDATLFAKQEKYKLNLSDYTTIKGWLKTIK